MIEDAANCVLSELGLGHKEAPYHKALEMELSSRGCGVQYKKHLNLTYKGSFVGHVEPDLIVKFEDVEYVVELKVLPKIGNKDVAQLRKYLKLTECPVGYVLNFHAEKGLELERVTL